MKMVTEMWNGHEIRFVEKEKGEWWAVANDAANALGIGNTTMALRRIDDDYKALITVEGLNRANQSINVLSEYGLYKLILTSRKSEAREFEKWILSIIKTLREASGLHAFQVFRMLDKEHQREAMHRLCNGLHKPVRVDFIKANVIANKAISSMHGLPKMMKKGSMTPEMLLDRQGVLDDTVMLMTTNDSFGLGLCVSDAVYAKYAPNVLN